VADGAGAVAVVADGAGAVAVIADGASAVAVLCTETADDQYASNDYDPSPTGLIVRGVDADRKAISIDSN
jgi:hypothetical protein